MQVEAQQVHLVQLRLLLSVIVQVPVEEDLQEGVQLSQRLGVLLKKGIHLHMQLSESMHPMPRVNLS